MPNSPELQKLIMDNKHCWWWVADEDVKDLTVESIVEGILNRGSLEAVKGLFRIVGLKKVAAAFYRTMNISKRVRNNYFKPTRHYFDLYFKKYAS